jgi:hypothetical protein
MNYMINKLFASKNPEGYTLKRSTREEGEVTHYEDVLKRATYAEIIGGIVYLPDEFYAKDEVIINFGNADWPICLSSLEKKDLADVVREHREQVKGIISKK